MFIESFNISIVVFIPTTISIWNHVLHLEKWYVQLLYLWYSMLILHYTLVWCIIVVIVCTFQITGVIVKISDKNEVSAFFSTEYNCRTIRLILFFDALTFILHHCHAIFCRFYWISSVTSSSYQLFFTNEYSVCMIRIVTYLWCTHLWTSSLSFIVTLLQSNILSNSKVRAVVFRLNVTFVWLKS